jgi:hypothetical protein
MVVGFKTTYAINAYHHYCSVFQSRSRDMYSAQNDVTKFVSHLRQIDGTRREPPTLGKQLVNFITCGCESSAPFFVIYKAGLEPTPYWCLPVDLMLYNHEAEFMQERIKESKSFNLEFTYIDDVLSMSYSDLASWMPLIYPLQSLR